MKKIPCLAVFAFAVLCAVRAADPRPNVIVILSDDVGYSDLGCFGGEIETPHLDSLAQGGPDRAPYSATAMINEWYAGDLRADTVTISEVLRGAGYRNYAVGKWHVTKDIEEDASRHN